MQQVCSKASEQILFAFMRCAIQQQEGAEEKTRRNVSDMW